MQAECAMNKAQNGPENKRSAGAADQASMALHTDARGNDAATAPAAPGAAGTDAHCFASPLEAVTPNPESATARSAAIKNLLASLDAADITYAITHGYEELGQRCDSDVDLLIAPRDLSRKLPAALAAAARRENLIIVQWLRGFPDDAQYIVLANMQAPAAPWFIVVHVAPCAGLCGRMFFPAAKLLRSRQRLGDFFILPPALEFAAYLARKVAKAQLDLPQYQTLARRYALDPTGCAMAVRSLWRKPLAEQIIGAFENNSADAPAGHALLVRLLPRLRAALLRGSLRKHPAHAAKCAIMRQCHRVQRYARPPAGLHVVFLGPDGVGKTTVLERVFDTLGPAFPARTYRTFAPGLIFFRGNRSETPVSYVPHGKPPRSLAPSLIKAGWWFTYYTAGYWVTVRRDIARSALSINHRYFMDALVDPKRYRYGGPHWLLQFIWKCSAKPGITLVLDAPADVIQRRKQEVPPEETQRQLNEYRGLLKGLKHGHLVNAAQDIQAVTAQANGIIINHMAQRTARRMGLAASGKEGA